LGYRSFNCGSPKLIVEDGCGAGSQGRQGWSGMTRHIPKFEATDAETGFDQEVVVWPLLADIVKKSKIPRYEA
jgi:hypothetical protein